MFVRLNAGLQAIAGKPPFDHRFGVAVPLRAPNEHGLPTNQEAEALNGVEDELLAAFDASSQTLLAVVITTGGFREFVFYTAAPADVAPKMERLRTRVTSHELQFYAQADPAWEVYKSFLP